MKKKKKKFWLHLDRLDVRPTHLCKRRQPLVVLDQQQQFGWAERKKRGGNGWMSLLWRRNFIQEGGNLLKDGPAIDCRRIDWLF